MKALFYPVEHTAMRHINATPMQILSALSLSIFLSGCGVMAVAGATAGAAISVAGAVVSTGVKVTGKVIEKTIDVVTPSSPSDVRP